MIDSIYIEPNPSQFVELSRRPKKNEENLVSLMSDVFRRVESDGDKALLSLTEEYDKVKLNALKVTREEIEMAQGLLSNELKDAIGTAKSNITQFHKAQLSPDLKIETMKGVICMQKSVGIERVGIYIPGGTAPLFSTVLMLAIPAVLAGCKEIVLCSPPNKSGKINPAILYAAKECGLRSIFKVGGAQAVAAMTFGTETIPSVCKVFGPGNQYVMAAKMYAQKFGVGMDTPAGPSELLVYADESSNPGFVASDLLSQAEHGGDSQVILVTSNVELLEKVNAQIFTQLKELPRKGIAIEALKNSKALIINNPQKAFDFINEYGPEHLILATENYESLTPMIINAGSVFLGNYCPESAGDYASGTNHTLPTDGWSKSYSGVNVDSFSRKITFQSISKSGINAIGDTIIEMAENEGLQAHANAVTIRLNELKQENK